MSDRDLMASEILVCDACRTEITDLDLAMFFWDTVAAERARATGTIHINERTVTAFFLAHKNCASASPEIDRVQYSAELSWCVDPSASLRRLAELLTIYDWTQGDARRLAQILWAVPLHPARYDEHLRSG